MAATVARTVKLFKKAKPMGKAMLHGQIHADDRHRAAGGDQAERIDNGLIGAHGFNH